MQTTGHFCRILATFISWMLVLAVNIAAADEKRFVRPEDTTTYIDPVSKSEIRVVIDQQLGGTSDVTVAELVIPPGVDVPDHVHQSTEFFIFSPAN